MNKLTYEDRKKIEELVSKGMNQSKIANVINVNRSTICRELKRSTPYKADVAEENFIMTRNYVTKNPENVIKIKALYKEGLSIKKIHKITGNSRLSIKAIVKEK